MHYRSIEHFIRQGAPALTPGPVAIILAEDECEIASTLRHHLDAGFSEVVVPMHRSFVLEHDLATRIRRVDLDLSVAGSDIATVNTLIAALPGRWLYYGYNAEYLIHPFCETRRVGEMLAFHEGERRAAMLTTVVDLYARDLDAAPGGVSLRDCRLDRSGYFTETRHGPDGAPLPRQFNFYGGLRWRLSEHVPEARRRIDRIALFRAKPGLHLRADHTFDDDEYNTLSCPWHHNLTAAVCSFRAAKALRANPGSCFDITRFDWFNSAPFGWNSRQLLDLGLIEPGQWF